MQLSATGSCGNDNPAGRPAFAGAPGLAGFGPGTVVVITSVGVRSITARANLYFYPAHMPWGLERWHGGHDLHFITFSCYDSQPLLATAQRRDLFLQVLERVRRAL